MGTPIPHRDNEMRGTGAGPVTTYRLTPEEIAALSPAKPIPRNHTPPIHLPERRNEEEIDLAKYEKDQYLELLAAGMDRKSIARKWGVTTPALKPWLKKWGILDPAQEEIALADYQQRKGKAKVSDEQPTEAAHQHSEVDRLRTEIELLRTARAELRSERDDLKRAVEDLEKKVDELSTGILERDGEISRLKLEVEELTSDRQVLLATIEMASAPVTATAESDPVNHPAHYTAGGIECIDAIEAATVGLTGGLAYSTGAAIKYLWRWSRKNGAEDLRKARWYIDRLIGEVEGKVG